MRQPVNRLRKRVSELEATMGVVANDLRDTRSELNVSRRALRGMLEWARRVKHANPGPEVRDAIAALETVAR